MKRKTYVRRGAIILAVMMLVSLCGMLPTAALYRSAGCCRRPRCIELDENGYAVRMPTRIIDNNNSLLDINDSIDDA